MSENLGRVAILDQLGSGVDQIDVTGTGSRLVVSSVSHILSSHYFRSVGGKHARKLEADPFGLCGLGPTGVACAFRCYSHTPHVREILTDLNFNQTQLETPSPHPDHSFPSELSEALVSRHTSSVIPVRARTIVEGSLTIP